jgi:hypothetical protein
MKNVIFASGVALLVIGCSDSVPNVQDPHNIVVAGEPMTQQRFLEKYCAGKTQHETCNKVYRAMIADSTYSKHGVARF